MASFPNFAVARDTESAASISFANSGQQPANAFKFDMKQANGTFIPLWITPYQHGTCIEHDQVIEFWVPKVSFHNNLRSFPPNYHVPPEVWFGDELDMGGVMIQGNQTLRKSGGVYVIDPGTGQPFVDAQWGTIVCQRFTGFSHGDLRLVVRGATDGFSFRVGLPGNEVEVARIDATGIHFGALNLATKIEELDGRVTALEGA